MYSFAFATMASDVADKLVAKTNVDIGGRTARFELRGQGSGAGDRSFERPRSAPSASLIVKSLAWSVDDDKLGTHFEGCINARVITDRETGNSKG